MARATNYELETCIHVFPLPQRVTSVVRLTNTKGFGIEHMDVIVRESRYLDTNVAT